MSLDDISTLDFFFHFLCFYIFDSDETENNITVINLSLPTSTFSYFLCYEDIPNTHAEAEWDSQSVSHGDVVRMWSIGQWVQADPNPDTEDIYDWYADLHQSFICRCFYF